MGIYKIRLPADPPRTPAMYLLRRKEGDHITRAWTDEIDDGIGFDEQEYARIEIERLHRMGFQRAEIVEITE